MDQLSESALIEFLGLFLAEREAGAARSLPEYLALFAGHEEAIAEAYLAATRERANDAAATTDDGRRVGPFRLMRELGRGGQGTVWLAHDERLGRLVALKLTPRSPLFDDLSPRFQREARAASRLEHPGLCSVYDIGADERVAWIAMRYVEGETVASQLAAWRAGGAALDARELDRRLELLEKTARALHFAHEAGIVHRDIKPSNVMVTARGEPVILDFGIARESDDGAPITLSGETLGTPAYMAPEELRGDRRAADRRCDVWSLGVTAYEALTGKRPFEAPTREALVREILDDQPVEPPLARDLGVVLLTALAKEPDRRYQTALDFAEDLRRVRLREPIRARPASAFDRIAAWRRRNPALAASLLALLIVLVAGLATALTLLRRTRNALESRERLLGDVTQLSDQTLAHELVEHESKLWPASEAMLPQFANWLASAKAVLGRRERHAAAREQIAARTDLDVDPARNAQARAWLLEQLDELLGSLERLDVACGRVETRRAFAASVRRRSIDEHRAEWDRALAEIASDPRYGGLRMSAQIGLAPLGRDPQSGWQEFAHLESGEIPQRDSSSGRLALTEADGIVLVLLPAASVDIGCEKPTAERPLGMPNVDPNSARWDSPVRVARLNAFFLSKFEMTQGQWLRHTHANPSVYQAPSRLVSKSTPLLHPVEHVSWYQARDVLSEMQLVLPTEARWEYGTRGGTRTPWFTGESFAGLDEFANLADKHARENEGGDNWTYELSLDDGYVGHAPVGSLRGNAFGLHDVIGNVEEWCLDTWEDLALVEPRDGDGLLIGTETACSQRGGSFSDHPLNARSGYRGGSAAHMAAPSWGVRAAREIDP